MQPLSKKEVIANCMKDLAEGFEQKYGYADFLNEMIDESIKQAPKNISALQLKADILTSSFKYRTNKYGLKYTEQLPDGSPLKKQYEEMLVLYHKIDELGYTTMSDHDYQEWLKSCDEEKNKQQQEELDQQYLQLIEWKKQ